MKRSFIKKLPIALGLFTAGAIGYMLIELAWRRRTHILMGAAGGVCLNLIYSVSRIKRVGIMLKSAVSSLLISTVELIFGVVCNLGLNMNIWDYSTDPCNLLGQICPRYSLYWFLLSLPITAVFGIFDKKHHAQHHDEREDDGGKYTAA